MTGTTRSVLGLDLGVGSVGWALITENQSGSAWVPSGIQAIGVRVFEKGMEEDRAGIKRTSPAAARRGFRSTRRRVWRRATRKRGILSLLQELGCIPSELPLPQKPGQTPIGLWCQAFDLNWWGKHSGGHREAQVIPYAIRAEALNRPLLAEELGRALLHLSQRRGYQSNRLGAEKEDDKELGKVKSGISDLTKAMEEVGAPTLGAYLAGLDPDVLRIRSRWTARTMFKQELERILEAQAPHHPALTPEAMGKLRKLFFFQRPLWWPKSSIGKCELEPRAMRAPMAALECQRFRILQRVNDLKIDGGSRNGDGLNDEERKTLLFALDQKEFLSPAQARKLLGLTERGVKFNFEREDDPRPFKGNVTASRIRESIGARWDQWAAGGRADALVGDLLSIQNQEALERRLVKAWGLGGDEAKKLAGTPLESSRLALSRKALKRLLPLMEKGVPYSTARKEAYPDADKITATPGALPSVNRALPHLANPMVARTLTEMRKVVNAIIKAYGRPDLIRIELARDLKNSEDDRREIGKKNKEREADRKRASSALKDQHGIADPSRMDIEKWLLWEECNHHCPYTGRPISGHQLFVTGEVQVEHIWPFSRTGHNGFHNKTLCFVSENQRKGNRTPFEVYGSDSSAMDKILERVGAFQGRLKAEKLRRFEASEIPDFASFTDRELNDTRFISRAACGYLAGLYGGLFTPGGARHVEASKGGITAHLREILGLNHLLHELAADLDPTKRAKTREAKPKPRDDHRHHAVDALVTALTAPAIVKELARLSEKGATQGRLLPKGELIEPWRGFLDEVGAKVRSILVSRRIRKKADGGFHDATFYGPAVFQDGKQYHAVRKDLAALSKSMVEAIVDPTIKALVIEKLGGKEPKQVFAKAENLPHLPNRKGAPMPIKRVRIWVQDKAQTIGHRNGHPRNVLLDGNHHLEIFEDGEGPTAKWIGRIVTLIEARRRVTKREPVVMRTWEGRSDLRFVCSLAIGEQFALVGEGGEQVLFSVRTVYPAQGGYSVDSVRHLDAREKKLIRETGGWVVKAVNGLRSSGFTKVIVDPIGHLHPARD